MCARPLDKSPMLWAGLQRIPSQRKFIEGLEQSIKQSFNVTRMRTGRRRYRSFQAMICPSPPNNRPRCIGLETIKTKTDKHAQPKSLQYHLCHAYLGIWELGRLHQEWSPHVTPSTTHFRTIGAGIRRVISLLDVYCRTTWGELQ